MSTVRLDQLARGAVEIPMQPASEDIWDKKYRLKTKKGEPVDATIDHTYQRVAKALADAEATPEKRSYWYERFLWALRRGAIPAGRITSNAGALEHKPTTTTINCTVSGTIDDSMDGILDKVHEAGLTLKAGCGIGYEFSTLRPRGAYVSGAGAYTSGPLSFMDIYDKMCFTVSLGRRPPRRADGHLRRQPSGREGIHRAKREDGRLRQFNLSLLITDEFMDAVETRQRLAAGVPGATSRKRTRSTSTTRPRWSGANGRRHRNYVTRDDGLVACKIYGHIRARAAVEHDHGVDVRLRRAGFHPDRPRQRDEQQLVVREHPRDQPVRRAAAAAVRLLPARLDQPDHLRARSVRPQGALRLGGIQGSRARVHAHARQRGRGQRPAAGAAARRDRCASAATAWASWAWAAR